MVPAGRRDEERGAIVTMIWFYVSGLAILIGAELNGVIDGFAAAASAPAISNLHHDPAGLEPRHVRLSGRISDDAVPDHQLESRPLLLEGGSARALEALQIGGLEVPMNRHEAPSARGGDRYSRHPAHPPWRGQTSSQLRQ